MRTSSKLRGRPKTTSDGLQRDIIVVAARRLFIERGYAPTKTDDIAASCKISKQTLYRLFPCKSDLFMAVVESHQQIWLDLPRFDDHAPLSDTLMQIFQVDISDEADLERTDLVRLVLAETRANPELSQILKTHGLEASRKLLAEWLDRQQALGRMKTDNGMALAQLLIDMVFGAVIIKHFDDVTWPTGADRRQHIERCVKVFLSGAAVQQKAGI